MRLQVFIACLVMTVSVFADVSGAGATFPYPLYARWAQDYREATGERINYQAIGSGGGIKQITAGTVDFGASDMPLHRQELDSLGLEQFPAIVGGVAIVAQVPGVVGGQLVLSGPVLADIFLGKITRWNAPDIERLNPGLALPKRPIVVVHRADGSGTTFNFSHYLAAVSESWREQVGVSTALKWPTGIGGKGNEGVANYVRQVRASIGYVEYAYALQANLGTVRLVNADGAIVEPGWESFQAASASAR
jgi:phosphate transport system substrate-binding protein